MNPEDKAEIKKEIEAKVAELKNRIVELKESTKPIAPDSSLGRLTRLDAMQLKAVSEADLERCQEELESLQQKLLTIDSPSFGICRICQQAINIERVKAMPESDLCIVCAQNNV